MTIISFRQNNNKIVNAINRDDDFVFQDIDNNEYKWIADIKELHAQKIVNDYVAQLSRVGIDGSEWLRLWSQNK
ncbi:MAG: hypothetical protein HQK99_02095 [Nitrospirae bacterium]|nr:hypothetical protein [Nitrospirota bacterium]